MRKYCGIWLALTLIIATLLEITTMADKPRHIEGYTLEVYNDEVFLSHPTHGRVLKFNATASLIWQLCDGERTGAEIAELIAAAFPTKEDRIPEDVEATLQELAELGAIELV
jgi:hypothetical protein